MKKDYIRIKRDKYIKEGNIILTFFELIEELNKLKDKKGHMLLRDFNNLPKVMEINKRIKIKQLNILGNMMNNY